MPTESRSFCWGWVLLLLAVFAVAISGESLWIDEDLTATKVSAGAEYSQLPTGLRVSDMTVWGEAGSARCCRDLRTEHDLNGNLARGLTRI